MFSKTRDINAKAKATQAPKSGTVSEVEASTAATPSATQPPVTRLERSGLRAAENSGVVVVACIGIINSSALSL